MMRRRLLILLTAPALLLTACATPPTPLAETAASPYGAFLAARYAGAQRDASGAAEYYGRAASLAPGESYLAERAFLADLMAGQLQSAAVTGRAALEGGDDSRTARLYLAADAVARRRYEEALALLPAEGFGPFNAYLSEILSDWALAGRGARDEALARARALQAPGFSAAFLSMHRAMLLEYAGLHEEAESEYRSALAGSPLRRFSTELYGTFLERRGRRADAIALYESYLANAAGETSLVVARDRAQRRGRPPRLTAPVGAARAVFGPAAWLASEADMDLSVIYLRLAQRLDPDYAATGVLLAGTLERIGLTEAALAEYAAVPPGPFRLPAQSDRVMLLARTGMVEQALPQARALWRETGAEEARLLLADLLRATDECAEAAQHYAAVITARETAGDPSSWRFHYFRGVCLERTDRWEEAETEFLAALELEPDEPGILNYLGYVWVERGEHLELAFEMIRRAAELRPAAGHIIDSLGWAHYALGRYEEAVEALERAAALSPDSPVVNSHLGDAYWRVGRRLEAGFQWRRALSLDPEVDLRAELEDRLENGLPESAAPAPASGGGASAVQ